MLLTGNGSKTGPLVIAFFITLSFAVKGFQPVKGLSFTMWMFTAVTAAMFYPQYFVSMGGFPLKSLIVPSFTDNNVWHGFTDEPERFYRSYKNA